MRDSLLQSSAEARGEGVPASVEAGELSLCDCLDGSGGAGEEALSLWIGGVESPAVGRPVWRPACCPVPVPERGRRWCFLVPGGPVLTPGGEGGRSRESQRGGATCTGGMMRRGRTVSSLSTRWMFVNSWKVAVVMAAAA